MDGSRAGRALSVIAALLVVVLFIAGCAASRPEGVKEYYAGEYQAARDIYTEKMDTQPNSAALYALLLGTLELTSANVYEARECFIEATGIMDSFAAKGEAGAVVGQEASKEYKGDPYERMMAHWYLGLVDYMLGDYDKAIPDFKAAALADGGSGEERYQSDAASVFLMLAKSYQAIGASDKAAYEFQGAVAVENPSLAGVPLAEIVCEASDPSNNLLVLVGLGRGPFKYRSGEHGRLAKIGRHDYPERTAWVYIDGHRIGRTQTIEDIYFQASTRGGRAMDAILAGKAVFKDLTAAAAAEAFDDAWDSSKSQEKRREALVGGILLTGVSTLISAEADIRSWETLPDRIQVLLARVEPGEHTVGIRFFGDSAPLEGMNASASGVDFQAGRETVFYVRARRGGAWVSPLQCGAVEMPGE
ncbi:MAG: tetratricopeptide repeat protein [Planctomycetes bacterium]|nr:tetratricopeptide repeat protein [Planctomycetota bacterium]